MEADRHVPCFGWIDGVRNDIDDESYEIIVRCLSDRYRALRSIGQNGGESATWIVPVTSKPWRA